MKEELLPTECELCECQEFQWNMHPCLMKGDPPETCICGHFAFRHIFRYRQRYPKK